MPCPFPSLFLLYNIQNILSSLKKFINKEIKSMKKLLSIILVFTLVFTLMSFGYAEAAASDRFTDVKSTHWAYFNINELVELGVINGYSDGTFKPSKEIRVDEFIKLTVTVLGYFPEASITGYWADPYIKKAKELKLIGPNEFSNYQRAIKREEMASIIVNAYTLNNTVSQGTLKTVIAKTLKDYSLINDNYKDAVLVAYQEGLIAGKENNNFDPRGYATRAEASTVIMRLLYDNLRKPATFSDIPSTYVSVNVFDEVEWWNYTVVQQKYYAPINDKGEPVKEVITLHDEIKKIEKQDYGYFDIMYNPYGQNLGVMFFPDIETTKLPTLEKLPHVDMVFDIHELDFKEGHYPYHLGIYRNSDHHADMTTYYSYLEDRYGDFFRVYAEIIFEDKASYFLDRFEKAVNNTKQGILQEEKYVLNGRNVYIVTNNGISVYVSDTISE